MHVTCKGTKECMERKHAGGCVGNGKALREGVKRNKDRHRKDGLGLRALATPPEDLSSFPEPTWHFTTIYNHSSRESDAFS